MGFLVIDEAARRAGVSCDREALGALVGKAHAPVPMLLAKPLTFMNLSGQAVRALADFHKVEVADLLVIADDVNLPLGGCGRGPADRPAATTGSSRSPSTWAPISSRGCGSAWGAATIAAIWPTTCWPGSTRTSVR